MPSLLENLYVLKNHSFKFLSNFCYNTNICILLNHLKVCIFKKTVAILIPNSTSFSFFIFISMFTFNFTNFFRKSINDHIWDNFFVISSPLLSILVTSFSIGIVKIVCFSIFSTNQISCFLNSSANSIMLKRWS